MPDKKALTRSFESELRSLPVELVPPDPAGLERSRKPRLPLAPAPAHLPAVDAERGILNKLIDRIKHL